MKIKEYMLKVIQCHTTSCSINGTCCCCCSPVSVLHHLGTRNHKHCAKTVMLAMKKLLFKWFLGENF